MSDGRWNAKSAGEWAAVAPTYVGLLILLLSFLLFAGTAIFQGHGVASPAILAAAGALITAGQAADVTVTLRKAAAAAKLPPADSAPSSEEP